MERLARMDL